GIKNYHFFSSTRETWEAMYRDISQAEDSIYWETFIFQPHGIGLRFIEKLKEKAMAGVEVKLILDDFGSWQFTENFLKELERAGAEVLYFNPLRLSAFWRGVRHYFERTHRKLLIVDKKIGFIGGVGVRQETADWFDLHARVTGPIVRQLLKSFSRSYLAGGGTLNKIKHLFYLPIIKERFWRVFWHKPQGNFSIIRNLYLRAISRAKKSLTLVNPYFLPDWELLKALREARKRGVAVHIILPFKTDHSILTYAMRAYWRVLDSFGFKIYLVKKMIHAKAMLVDEKWAMMGSSNFDAQTFYRNHEANLIFTSRQMIEDLKRIFRGWKKHSTLFQPRLWAKRSWWKRIYEWFCRLLRPIL
ncbi:MAG: phosphatidylserine/phosphatidylglycerophosphate/cardiolipin synthase family protein, partial [Candidatus Magasanikbacteria bacterium]|nr:phosphatidylserine/phosphatidylglycerophosphate/cardiolipin synthase family protein [Candidatus Magasanikbacteria bacterium]